MSTSPSSGPSQSLVERAQTWVSDNKKAVIIGSAAAAIAIGAGIYIATAGPPSKPSKRSKDSSKSAPKKRKPAKDVDTPILEEKKPGERATKAYNAKQYDQAAHFYTKAIEITPEAQAVYYSNRAACYMNFSPPEYAKVIADCDEALKLDIKYIKALNRRATALESLSRLEEALRDFTASTILLNFTDNVTSNAVERVLKKLGSEKAAEILSTREPRLPSYTFISSYFAAFRERPLPQLPAERSSQGDETFLLATQALAAKDYNHAMTFVNESIEQGISWDEGKAEAYNLRATFKFLTGDVDGAQADLLQSIEFAPKFTQSLVKLASVYMEKMDGDKAFKCFEDAIAADPTDPDVYYHRGQVLFIMENYTGAAENYSKSTELDPDFLAVAQYKGGNLANSMGTFRRTLRQFPQRMGELLLDQQRFDEAIEKFDKAIELEKDKKPPNVLSLVNKGLAMYQKNQDMEAVERCCNEALEIDPECEAALSLQQSKVKDAVKQFERQAELARTEPELTNALTYKYASLSQLEFIQNYPDEAAKLNAMAQAGLMAQAAAQPY
ncbi:hypothetical protein DL96DRAFT_1625416 [Flagelloscypha sp. PMI_526]|nr:hypothetical protein DL96DRAFT_1625416 [Flagelloscypha sp. PMI_526]